MRPTTDDQLIKMCELLAKFIELEVSAAAGQLAPFQPSDTVWLGQIVATLRNAITANPT